MKKNNTLKIPFKDSRWNTPIFSSQVTTSVDGSSKHERFYILNKDSRIFVFKSARERNPLYVFVLSDLSFQTQRVRPDNEAVIKIIINPSKSRYDVTMLNIFPPNPKDFSEWTELLCNVGCMFQTKIFGVSLSLIPKTCFEKFKIITSILEHIIANVNSDKIFLSCKDSDKTKKLIKRINSSQRISLSSIAVARCCDLIKLFFMLLPNPFFDSITTSLVTIMKSDNNSEEEVTMRKYQIKQIINESYPRTSLKGIIAKDFFQMLYKLNQSYMPTKNKLKTHSLLFSHSMFAKVEEKGLLQEVVKILIVEFPYIFNTEGTMLRKKGKIESDDLKKFMEKKYSPTPTGKIQSPFLKRVKGSSRSRTSSLSNVHNYHKRSNTMVSMDKIGKKVNKRMQSRLRENSLKKRPMPPKRTSSLSNVMKEYLDNPEKVIEKCTTKSPTGNAEKPAEKVTPPSLSRPKRKPKPPRKPGRKTRKRTSSFSGNGKNRPPSVKDFSNIRDIDVNTTKWKEKNSNKNRRDSLTNRLEKLGRRSKTGRTSKFDSIKLTKELIEETLKNDPVEKEKVFIYKDELDSLREEVMRLRSTVGANRKLAQQQNFEISRQCNMIRKEYQDYQKKAVDRRKKLEQRNKMLEERVKFWLKEQNEKNLKLKTLKDRFAKANSRVAKIKSEKNQQMFHIKYLSNVIKDLENDNMNLRKSLLEANLKNKLVTTKSKKGEKISKIIKKENKKHVKQKEERIAKLEKKIKMLENEKQNETKSINAHKKQIKRLEKQIIDNEKLLVVHSPRKEAIDRSEVRKTISGLKIKLEQQKTEMKKKKKKLIYFQSDIDELEVIISSNTSQIEYLRSLLTNLTNSTILYDLANVTVSSGLPIVSKRCKYNDREQKAKIRNEILQQTYLVSNGGEEHFVKLLGQFEDEKDMSYTLIMERAEDDLFDFVMKTKLSFSKKMRIVKQITKCVRKIHSLEKVHCDLKPSNMFVFTQNNHNSEDDDVLVKIGDFEDTIDYNPAHIHTKLVGTFNYYDVNLLDYIQTQKEDPFLYKRDVFSLGITMFSIFFQIEPFFHFLKECQKNDPFFMNDTLPYELKRLMGDEENRKSFVDCLFLGVDRKILPFEIIQMIESCLNEEESKRPTIKELCEIIEEIEKKYRDFKLDINMEETEETEEVFDSTETVKIEIEVEPEEERSEDIEEIKENLKKMRTTNWDLQDEVNRVKGELENKNEMISKLTNKLEKANEVKEQLQGEMKVNTINQESSFVEKTSKRRKKRSFSFKHLFTSRPSRESTEVVDALKRIENFNLENV